MRHVIIGVIVLALAGCTSAGKPDPNLPGRISADLLCLSALAKAGISVQSTASGTKTATQVMAAIDQVGTSQLTADTLAACAQTMANAAADAQAIKGAAAAKAKAATPK